MKRPFLTSFALLSLTTAPLVACGDDGGDDAAETSAGTTTGTAGETGTATVGTSTGATAGSGSADTGGSEASTAGSTGPADTSDSGGTMGTSDSGGTIEEQCAELTPPQCRQCCGDAYPDGQAAYDTAFNACVCTNYTCGPQCSQSVCADPPNPGPSPTCSDCLDMATADDGVCSSDTIGAACDDAECDAYLGCTAGCG